jgi:hypothetical protein
MQDVFGKDTVFLQENASQPPTNVAVPPCLLLTISNIMSYLTIISESGFPHAACLLEHDESNKRWFGWLPGANTWVGGAVGEGFLDEQSREKDIARFVRWEISSINLLCAEANIRLEYTNGSGYSLGDRDCITLVSSVCSWCGLLGLPRHLFPLPGLSGYLPIEVVWKLGAINPWQRTHFGTVNDQPYPWNV